MKLSSGFWQTYKEIPNEAEIPSHQLMLRAGLIQKTASGIYSYLPLGLRTIRKVEKIIREELDKINCFEIEMSVVTPGELWKETGRWEVFGPQMLKMKDRSERDLCISPTNEETVTDIFRKTVKSYKQLPLTLYQINTKFRDEIRPRFGIMRGREFLMMDAYSFHIDKACLDQIYFQLYETYENIFKRMGLKFIAVEADAGAMAEGDVKTHEFQVLANSGEDQVIKCTACGHAANIEKSKTKRNDSKDENIVENLVEIDTPKKTTIEEVCQFLNCNKSTSLKTLIYTIRNRDSEENVILLLRGDDSLNEVKLKSYFKAENVKPASEKEMERLGLIKGYIGPYNFNHEWKIIYDESINLKASYVIGANKRDKHFKGFTPVRDHKVDVIEADLREAKEGDICILCNGNIEKIKGIEVGHIFQLGDKYTRSMKSTILDQNGKNIYPLMGCYGIGVTRTVAAAIEQSHDSQGIIWPVSIAPYQVYFGIIGKTEEIKNIGESLYLELKNAEIELILDDRNIAAGVMFKDADLLGLPLRIILGERDYKEKGMLEIKVRKTGEIHWVKKEEALKFIKNLLVKLS